MKTLADKSKPMNLQEAKTAYNKARRAYSILVASEYKTADNKPFQLDSSRRYWFVNSTSLIYRLNNVMLSENCELVFKPDNGKGEGFVIENNDWNETRYEYTGSSTNPKVYKISELYWSKSEADKKLVAMQKKQLQYLSNQIATCERGIYD